MPSRNNQLLVFLEVFVFFLTNNIGMATTMWSTRLSSATQFFCTMDKNVLVVFSDDSTQSMPRVMGLVDHGVCERSVEGRTVGLACGALQTGPVGLLIEYDDLDVYSLAEVTCNKRSTRQNFELMADRHKLQKAKAMMEIGLNYDNISEIRISCEPEGKVYLSNPNSTIYRHMFSFNKDGDICKTLMVWEHFVEITNCDQDKTIEITFGDGEFRDNIIGGRGAMKFYKFNCTEIGSNPSMFPEIILDVWFGGTSGFVTWFTIVLCALCCTMTLVLT